jgi:ABC-2 type transport system permease protein/lipopolysaccharide transport system permease protein
VSGTTEEQAHDPGTLLLFDPADIADEPPPESLYLHRVSLGAAARTLWKRKGIIVALAERDVRASYKQTIIGFGWALISPVIQVILFTLIFNRVKLGFNTGHVPYVLYAYAGILCWSYFSGSLGSGGSSLIPNMSLLQKTHFPRECFPLSQMLEQSLYTTIALIPLGILFVTHGFAPKPQVLWAPVFIAIELVFTSGVVLAMSALVVYVRDLGQVMGLITQIGLFASPVIWPLSKIPAGLRPYYAFVNPIGPVIDNVRRTMLLGHSPEWPLLGIAAISATLYCIAGYSIFKRLEVGFADIS